MCVMVVSFSVKEIRQRDRSVCLTHGLLEKNCSKMSGLPSLKSRVHNYPILLSPGSLTTPAQSIMFMTSASSQH